MESTAESITGIGSHYGVDGKQLSTQYKEHFSDYRQWEQLSHAGDWLLFDENLGESLSIDETCLSSGEVYTFLTNKAGKGGRGTLVAVVRGTKAEDVIRVLEKIDLSKRKTVKEITLDLSSSMMIIVHTVFPKALITSDRFHVQKLYYDALDDMLIAYRWMARDRENEEMKEAKAKNETYKPFRYSNGDTRKQLLARAKFILTKHKSKWTESQRLRAEIIFENYPELKKAYDLAMELTDIYNARSIKDAARLKLAKWFNKVEKLGVDNFYTVIDTFKNHYDTILNFFVNRATNANAESFNAKVKAFRAQFRGVTDIPFFLYRLMKLCA
ncbi:ISAon1 family transposase [Hoylesella timonensis]|uniref:ISAon1 family transposase n=1 Tax=Hoylesella timonensis TaxID=386414 RepID=UPI003EBCB7B8